MLRTRASIPARSSASRLPRRSSSEATPPLSEGPSLASAGAAVVVSGAGLSRGGAFAAFAPASNGAAQLQVARALGQRGQPVGDRAVRQHGEHGEAAVDAEAEERADHPALDAADAGGRRQHVAERADVV